MAPVTIPVIVKARNSVMRRLPPSRSEVVALITDEAGWWVGSGELAVLHVDDDEAARWSLRGRPGGGQHAVAVEVVDRLELRHHPGPRGLGGDGGVGGQCLHEE